MATGYGSAALMGGVADPRLGDEADHIGKSRQGSVAAEIRDGAVGGDGRERRRSVIYGDTSITFEDYVYWADRSREYERHLDTSNMGLQGILKVMLGKGVHAADKGERPVQELAEGGSSDDNEKPANDSSVEGAHTGRYGITESEWDNAQRAVRTATWGE